MLYPDQPGPDLFRAAGKSCTAILLVLCVYFQDAHAGELRPYEGIGDFASFELPDLGDTPHHLNDYRGHVVLVNFWASWCPPCLLEMPSMQRLKTALAGRPFVILAVNFKESKSKVWRFKKLLQVDFQTLLDSDGTTAEDWGVQIYPTSFLLDPEHRIRYVAYGAVEWDEDETIKLIEQLMADQTVPQQTVNSGAH